MAPGSNLGIGAFNDVFTLLRFRIDLGMIFCRVDVPGGPSMYFPFSVDVVAPSGLCCICKDALPPSKVCNLPPDGVTPSLFCILYPEASADCNLRLFIGIIVSVMDEQSLPIYCGFAVGFYILYPSSFDVEDVALNVTVVL